MNQSVFENNRRRAPSDGSDRASAMMRDGSLPARRRFELIRLAQRQGQLSVADLSLQFGVSSETIRRVPHRAVRDVVVLGGEYRTESHTTVGSVAFCGAIAFSADSAILGVGGITQDGIFAGLLQDATMTASMIAVARRTIVLADSAQFNHRLLARIATLDRIDILVTDAEPPKDLFAALETLEVQVMVASPLNSRQRATSQTKSGSNLTDCKSRS